MRPFSNDWNFVNDLRISGTNILFLGKKWIASCKLLASISRKTKLCDLETYLKMTHAQPTQNRIFHVRFLKPLDNWTVFIFLNVHKNTRWLIDGLKTKTLVSFTAILKSIFLKFSREKYFIWKSACDKVLNDVTWCAKICNVLKSSARFSRLI